MNSPSADQIKNQYLTPSEKVFLNLTEGKFLDVSALQTESRYIGIIEKLPPDLHGVTQTSCGSDGFEIQGLPIVSNNLQGYEEALRLSGLTSDQISVYSSIFLEQELEIEQEERDTAAELRAEGKAVYTDDLKTVEDKKAAERRHRLATQARKKLRDGKKLTLDEESALRESEVRNIVKSVSPRSVSPRPVSPR